MGRKGAEKQPVRLTNKFAAGQAGHDGTWPLTQASDVDVLFLEPRIYPHQKVVYHWP